MCMRTRDEGEWRRSCLNKRVAESVSGERSGSSHGALALHVWFERDRSSDTVQARFDEVHALLNVSVNKVGDLRRRASLHEAIDVAGDVIAEKHVLIIAVLPLDSCFVVTDLEELVDARRKKRAGEGSSVVDPCGTFKVECDHVRSEGAGWVQRAAGKSSGPELGDEKRLEARKRQKSVRMNNSSSRRAETHKAN